MPNILVNTENLTNKEWLEYRKQGIGGSDVAAICGISKYKSPVELWMEKTGQIEPKEAGESAYWGTIMEPIIRNEFTLRTNLKVNIVKSILKHSTHEFMLANLDGIIYDPVVGNCIFEAKTASIYNQDKWENDNIPEEYMLQIQHYMAVTGYKRTFIAVLLGGNHFEYKSIERDDELIDMIIKLELDFWNHVENNTPPEIDGSEASTELMSRLYPVSKKDKQIILPDKAIKLIAQYEIGKQKEKEAVELKDEAANKLKSILGDNESGLINDRIVSWKSLTIERFDSKLLQKEKPDIYTKYLNKSSSRRFAVK